MSGDVTISQLTSEHEVYNTKLVHAHKYRKKITTTCTCNWGDSVHSPTLVILVSSVQRIGRRTIARHVNRSVSQTQDRQCTKQGNAYTISRNY